MHKRNKNQPLYLISVVCDMLDVHPQTLRMYEKEGFISPRRVNRQRLYSDQDVEQLNFILQLTRELGVNKAGVDIILRLRHRMAIMNREMEDMMDNLDEQIRMDFQKRMKEAFKED